MTSPPPIDVAALGDAVVGARLWRGPRSRHLTVVVKAVLALSPDGRASLKPGPVIAKKERHYADSPRRSMEEGSDLAPYRPRCDVTVQGHAYAPPGQSVASHSVRLAIVRGTPLLDKRLQVLGDRTLAAPGEPLPFQRMPLDYEHAFGGKSHKQNPVGCGASGGGPQAALPNIVDPSDPQRTVGFAPLSRYWSDRTRLLGATLRQAVDADEPTIPEGFDWGYFQAAPADQQLAHLTGDEWIVLDGMHPALPRISCQLPNVRGAALMYLFDGAVFGPATPITLVADTLAIDVDRMTASIVWRGSTLLGPALDPAKLRVLGAVQVDGAPIPWPNPRELTAPMQGSREPAPPSALRDETVTLSTSAEGRAQRSAPTPFAPSPEPSAPGVNAPPSRPQDLGHTVAAHFSADVTSDGQPLDAAFEGTIALPPQAALGVVTPFAAPVAPPSAPYQSPPASRAAPEPVAPPSAPAPNLDHTFRLSPSAAEEAAHAPAVPFRPADPDAPFAPPVVSHIVDEPSDLGSTISLRPEQASAMLEAAAPFPIARPKPRAEQREGVPRRESPQVPIVNRTSLTAATSPWQLSPPKDVLTVIVKGTFDLSPDDAAAIRPESDPLSGDVFSDDDPERGLLYPTDFAVFKPRADVLLVGHAHAQGSAVRASKVSFRFGEGALPRGFERELAVIGDRDWSGSVPGEPRPFERVPMVWERAFGGGPDGHDNPVGTGRHGTPPPNLEDPARLLRSAGDAPPPICFGPVSPQWRERRSKLGSYDDAWLETRWPYFPKDFDPAYFQSAPLSQRVDHLRGDESYVIAGAARQTLRGRLPELRVRAFRLATEDLGAELAEIPLVLDTALFDSDQNKLVLLWRGLVDVSDDEAPEIETLFIHSEPLASEPLPLDAIRRLLWQSASPAAVEEETVAEEPLPELDAEALAALRAQAAAALDGGAPLDDLDFAYADLTGLDFSGRSLVGANLKGASLRGCRFTGANLSQAVLAGADLSDADLASASLEGADLVGARLERAVFDGAALGEADFSMVHADNASFRGVLGENVQLVRGSFIDAHFERAELPSADFTEAKLDRAVFEHAKLREVKLYFASGERVRFDRADLTEARADDADLVKSSFVAVNAPSSVFEKAFLAGSSFLGARLAQSSFTRASCEGVDFGAIDAPEARFVRAKLANAKFLKANLLEADFERADLTDVDLRAANLHGAETWKAKLRGVKLEQAIVTASKLAGRAGRV